MNIKRTNVRICFRRMRRKRYEEKKISKKTVFDRMLYHAAFCYHSHRTEYAHDYGRRGTCDSKPILPECGDQRGDSLWNIARQYKKGSHMSTEEYVKELKRMNSLRSDTIHKGQFLTVVYYK